MESQEEGALILWAPGLPTLSTVHIHSEEAREFHWPMDNPLSPKRK